MQTALEKEVYQKYQTQDPTAPGPLPSALVFAIYHEIPNELVWGGGGGIAGSSIKVRTNLPKGG